MDSNTGEFGGFFAPTGLDAGKTFTTWIVYLHFGWVGGIAYRILIFVLGLVTTGLTVTGVLIWWWKLRRRSGTVALAYQTNSTAAVAPL
jgi:uncharacterized iron-regulated membrane protein